jgi:hypothetical protein
LLAATKHKGRLGLKGTRCGISTRENCAAASTCNRTDASRILAGFIGQIKRRRDQAAKPATDAIFDQLPAGLDGSAQIPATL